MNKFSSPEELLDHLRNDGVRKTLEHPYHAMGDESNCTICQETIDYMNQLYAHGELA
jgi:hypothetical protein